MKRHLFIILLLIATILSASSQDRTRIDQYLAHGETWLSDRLQMHWHTMPPSSI